jgi:hypothetical protein
MYQRTQSNSVSHAPPLVEEQNEDSENHEGDGVYSEEDDFFGMDDGN